MFFIYRITLRGTKAKDLTTLAFDLGDFVEPVNFADVQSAADQIRGALVDITDANVAKETLTGVVSEDNQIPADADTTDEAVVAVHLNAPTEAQKLHNLRVPAPIDALFLPNGITLDISNALLQAYVLQISQHAQVSDGETVNVASGTAGIDSGYWRSRSKQLK